MDLNLSFRKSTRDDEAILLDLFMEGFGEREDILTDLDNRYLMAFLGDELIGAVGLNYQKNYCGMEIDYCTVRKKYRHHSVMTALFEQILKDYLGRVYCCAWRINDNPECNLQRVLLHFGFEKVIDRMCSYKNGYNCHVKNLSGCSYFLKEGSCKCYEDLWVLEKKE